MLHRVRSLLVRQRTMLVNALRAHMAEFGIIAPQGLRHVQDLTKIIAHQGERLPALVRPILQTVVDQLNDTMSRVREIEARLAKWHRESPVSQLLATVPSVGIMGASAIAATVADLSLFKSGREFAAWLGMTPKQNSSGGKERLGRTSKRGDKYIRGLLIAGAVAVLRHARNRPTRDGEWVRELLEAQADQGRCCRAGQQDRADHLGCHDARRWLPRERGSRAAGIERREPVQNARVKRT
jgi:transposase